MKQVKDNLATRKGTTRTAQSRASTDDRTAAYRSVCMLLAGLAVAALIGFASAQVFAAGSDSSSYSPSSGTSYKVSNPSKAMRMATSLISKEKYAEALAQLETEVAADPKNADAWNLTGFVSRKLGDYSRSEKAYDTALAINPKHAGALEYKGELYLTLKNLAGAEEMLSRLKANCSFNCNELKALRKSINLYKKAN